MATSTDCLITITLLHHSIDHSATLYQRTMTRRQPLSLNALFITTILLTGGANAFVPANYRNPSLGQKKGVFSGNQFALKQPQPHAPTISTEIISKSSSSSSSTSSTCLQMVAPTGAALAAITGAMTGGLFAGGLHAMSGKLMICADLALVCVRGKMLTLPTDGHVSIDETRRRRGSRMGLKRYRAAQKKEKHAYTWLALFVFSKFPQDRITWQHSYLDAVDSVGTVREPSVLSGAWATESRPLLSASWPLP
jgi:hypothetical protein